MLFYVTLFTFICFFSSPLCISYIFPAISVSSHFWTSTTITSCLTFSSSHLYPTLNTPPLKHLTFLHSTPFPSAGCQPNISPSARRPQQLGTIASLLSFLFSLLHFLHTHTPQPSYHIYVHTFTH